METQEHNTEGQWFARWNDRGGFVFCSCGRWHWVDWPKSQAKDAEAR